MDKQQLLHLRSALAYGIDEINRLRNENRILRAKVETMELMGAALRAQVPGSNLGMAEDGVGNLYRQVDRIDAELAHGKDDD